MRAITAVKKVLKATIKKDHSYRFFIPWLRSQQRALWVLMMKHHLPMKHQPYRVIACENHISAVFQIMCFCEAAG